MAWQAVHGGGARKAARIVAVKASADTALNALLTKVDREVITLLFFSSLLLSSLELSDT